eukprot:TRINITY_DN7699_c0_g1_i1.p2 TRINITY_DN7699_c0_g1~~TRINITY_DN7699_c0_g1_i1.p2  ORF type:complete len:105 (+),score=22.20 TRINITY_DN7699_c0_g1_i1:395-709(+)
MSLAIARSCVAEVVKSDNFELDHDGLSPIIESFAVEFIRVFFDMKGRFPGGMTKIAVKRLGFRNGSEGSPEEQRTAGCPWYDNPYSPYLPMGIPAREQNPTSCF